MISLHLFVVGRDRKFLVDWGGLRIREQCAARRLSVTLAPDFELTTACCRTSILRVPAGRWIGRGFYGGNSIGTIFAADRNRADSRYDLVNVGIGGSSLRGKWG